MGPLLIFLAVLSAAGAPTPSTSELTGAASPLLPNLCEASDRSEGAILRCAALPGTDVFLRGPETAREIAIGQPKDFLPAAPDGARLGRSVAWRLLGARPVAAILRFRFDEGGDVLVVLKPVREGQEGCVVGAVEGAGGADAERAASLADREAPLFRCGRHAPILEGPWSRDGRARMMSWPPLAGAGGG